MQDVREKAEGSVTNAKNRADLFVETQQGKQAGGLGNHQKVYDFLSQIWCSTEFLFLRDFRGLQGLHCDEAQDKHRQTNFVNGRFGQGLLLNVEQIRESLEQKNCDERKMDEVEFGELFGKSVEKKRDQQNLQPLQNSQKDFEIRAVLELKQKIRGE